MNPLPILCALPLLVGAFGACPPTSAAQIFQGIPRSPSALFVELAVVEVKVGEDEQAVEAEIDAERDLWGDQETLSPGLVVVASFRGPTVMNYTNRLELASEERVDVTLLDRDKRRIRVLVAESLAGDERVERILSFRLDRSTRPARGRLVAPLSAKRRWLRLDLRRP